MRYLTFLIFTVAFIAAVACARANQPADNTTVAAANAVPAATPPPASPAPSEIPTPADDAPRITLEEAKKAYDEGKAFIIDARAEEAYKSEHIKGAVNIRHDNLDAMLKTIPKDKTVIVYCS
jgi:3-mercaptopyruvate sulfurtransferase SseA